MRRLLRAVALLSLTLGASPFAAAQVAPTSQPGPLIGVWASETTFGPALRGELSVVRGDSVRFAFPGGLGEFRGTLGDKGRAITGFWIQPGSVVLGYPFASPLALRVADPGVWRGTVVPLDDRFSLYLVVWKKDDGTLVGAFRNPELNSRGGASSWVTRSTSPQMVISEATTGLDSTRFAESYNKAADGYAWHLSMLESGGRTYREYEASGNGGQLLMVVPELDRAVVFTAGNYTHGGIWQRFRDVLLANVIIPALKE